jgi:photosystem II stability/assembly factor-like uncharacterized protein
MKNFTLMAIVVIYCLSSSFIFSQDFWQHTGGPLGGTTVCATEADNGDLILGTVEGIFRSSDAGANWVHSENGIGSTNAITDIYKHSNGDVYAIGSDRILGHSRLFLSADNGQNWTEIPNVPILPATTPTQFVVVNSSGDIFIAGTIIGSFIVSRSTDDGATWTTVFSPGGVFGIISGLAINSNGDLFVSVSGDVDKGVHSSTDNGDTWTQVFTDKVEGLYVHTNNDIYIFSGSSVLISSNNGTNWNEIYDSGAFLLHPVSIVVTSAGNIFIGTSLGIGGSGIERSADGGTTWEYVNNGLPAGSSFYDYPTINFLFQNSGGKLFSGIDSYFAELNSSGGMGGVYSSPDNGDNWSASNNGLLALNIKGITIHSSGNIFVMPFAGLLHSSDDGVTWSDRSPELTGAQFELSAFEENPVNGDIFAGGAFTLQHSTDLGINWTEYSGGYFSTHMVAGVAINNSGDIFVASNGGVYRTTDNGASWTQVYQGNTLNVFTASNGYVYYIGFVPGGLYRSTDNGDTWNQLTNGISGGISDLAIASDNTLYAVDAGNGIYRSDDSGDSWVLADNGIPKGSNGLFMFTVYAMTTNSAGHIFASIKYLDNQDVTHYDMFRSLNKGNGWSTLSNGLIGDYTFVNDISIGTDNFAYAGATNGIYQSAYPTGVEKEESNQFPVSHNLEQNYPNPFNPSTKIKFSVSTTSFVSLKVYDALGREVAELVNEELSQGEYKVDFNADGITSGIYFYTLKADGFIKTKKMILLR